ncbi:MAG: GntP family permease [Lachnospiraceae bacterium]|jgi:GntP family gluconate:H+ symporter|nr:GntP family permease [Lachnospiraceae bacterium]
MDMMVFVWLMFAIIIILFTILQMKLNPAIALVLGSIFMGLAAGLGAPDTISLIGSGFGNLMTGIGLSVGFGVILGQLLSDSGGAKAIAVTMIQATSEKYALYALGITAFLLSIPVFYDVTFVILIPLAIAVSRQIQKPLPYTVGAMIIGAGAAHTLAPPTPNPLAAAEILHFDLGIMVLVGILLGLVAAVLAMKIFFVLLDKGFWNQEKDETGVEVYEEHHHTENEKAPSFGMALVPVLLPVVLILVGTVMGAMMEEVPAFVNFLSNKTTALLLGALSAYLVSAKALDKDAREQSATEALKSCGIVLLITGAGGSFGAIISATGLADMLAETIQSISASPLIALLLAFVIAALFRVALGSGTVASITTMTIMASVPAAVGMHPVWMAIACLSGSLSCGHVNDSGFWVSTNLSGFTVTGGLKSYTLGNAITAFIAMLFAMIGCLIF